MKHLIFFIVLLFTLSCLDTKQNTNTNKLQEYTYSDTTKYFPQGFFKNSKNKNIDSVFSNILDSMFIDIDEKPIFHYESLVIFRYCFITSSGYKNVKRIEFSNHLETVSLFINNKKTAHLNNSQIDKKVLTKLMNINFWNSEPFKISGVRDGKQVIFEVKTDKYYNIVLRDFYHSKTISDKEIIEVINILEKLYEN